MNWTKKFLIRALILLYGLSYLLQNSFFIDRKKVYAAENPDTTNLVAVFVDKDIYADIKTNLVRYTSKYIQKKIANSKAVVFPIDTTKLKAHEISQILENMYFEGTKDQSSKLVGTILIGNIPLPVVENQWFIYPSIYPYVDFEDQQFIYDTNKRFFVYNNNPNGQAELRHGMIKFDTIQQYNNFFNKVRSYYNNPTQFIDKAIRYEDFIGLKKYFIPENTKYYANNILFSEDIGYHRFTNLLLNILNGEHNESTISLGEDLSMGLQDTEDPELQAYAEDMKSRQQEMEEGMQDLSDSVTSTNQGSQEAAWWAEMPTMTLKKATQEMLKWYDGLISSQFLSAIKDNVAGLARRYKTIGSGTNAKTFTNYSSLTDKIAQKDNRILGDLDNNVQPLLIQMNDYLENQLNEKIETEKYYLTIPIPTSELELEGDIKIPPTFRATGLPPPKCIWKTYNYYENYYFGMNANTITSAPSTSIYRWTYQNLISASGQIINDPLQSIGWSYDIFSVQTQANRGYNINSTKDELALYDQLKINKQELWNRDCVMHLFGYCVRWKKTRKPQDSDDEDKCYIGDEEKQGWCETITEFAQRYRWGASPSNIDAATKRLNNYNYKDARMPIYDIAGSRKVDNGQSEANSYLWAETYASIIQRTFAVKEKMENKYSNPFLYIKNPMVNGIDLKFTNQTPTNTDLENPVRGYNTPRTYTQDNFFSIFDTTQHHTIYQGKVMLYNWTPATDILNCNMKGHIYMYKTIDSRVKNISPTWDQISSTELYKFKDNSPLEIFYKNVRDNLSWTKADIGSRNAEYIGSTSSDMSWLVSNLTQVKQLVVSGNAGLQEIATFNPRSIIGQSQTWIANKANDRSGKNFTLSKITELTGRINKINEGLDSFNDYIGNLSINTTLFYLNDIIQSERFKNQNVEILDTRKTAIAQDMNDINTHVNTLKWTFTNARWIYNTIGQINTTYLATVSTQRALIASFHTGAGCTPSYYKAICDVLDNIYTTMSSSVANDINDKIDKIHNYPGDNWQVQPFVEINQLFSPTNISTEITQATAIINTFGVSTDPDKKEKNKGMNLATQDRPIDNIRNITFKGIGGDPVRLEYPNLYEVKVFKQDDGKLVLKTIDEIKEAIKEYLINKAQEYNWLLNEQRDKKNNGYYSTQSAKFNILGTLDPLANPNNHNYNQNPISEDFFIDKIIDYLDTLENAPEYGQEAIYGTNDADTTDEKLTMIAKLLYYQNITRPERVQQDTVMEDMMEIKDSFDINNKVSHVVQTYLTEGNNQGKFITPTYNTTWYEIAYINSDNEDYVSSKGVPSFIKTIQNTQENSPPSTVKFAEEDTDLQKEIDECEGVDVNGTALIFDFKTFTSPRAKAMKCRAKKILEKPFKFEINFNDALGDVFIGTFKEITNTFENFWTQRKEYGSQRTAPNNDDTIDAETGETREILRGYNNYAKVDTSRTMISLGVDDTDNVKIYVWMLNDFWFTKVKISWTWDNCLGVKRGNKTLSYNICDDAAEEFFNPYQEPYEFEAFITEKKAGSSSLRIEFCKPPLGKPCIVKQKVLQILPGPLAAIEVKTPTDIVMEAAELPIVINAKDAYGNTIRQTAETYEIRTNEGKISDGTSSQKSIQFNNFNDSSFIYQAMTGVKDYKDVTITVAPIKQKSLTLEATQEPKIGQKNIKVAKGIVTIQQNNIILHRTNLKQTNIPNITFTLPKEETSIQYADENGIKQIVPENIPSINIIIKTQDNKNLETVANITSKQGLLMPWKIKERTITKNGITKTQFSFANASNFIVETGRLDITLYPNFKAGSDIITINIPGIDPIIIPVTVIPWIAKKVILNLNKSRMDFSTGNNRSKGTIQVVDTRNNEVNTGSIKLWVIGAANTNINEFNYSWWLFRYTLTATGAGGEWYVFAYIKERSLSEQVPAYKRFIIQDSILPKEKLNVLYLNLFGTDRGNQRWYFSENENIVNNITAQSNKLLSTTTEIVDPTKIKQIERIITPNGQIQTINETASTLTIEQKKIVAKLWEIAEIKIGASNNFNIITATESWTIKDIEKNGNMMIYIPEPTDSIVTNNEASKDNIVINNEVTILDLKLGTINPETIITADNEMIEDMYSYTIAYKDKKIGTLMIRSEDDITTDLTNMTVLDPVNYGETDIFSEGSTNVKAIGIYSTSSAFTKQWYESIEDSSDPMLGIWFTNDFKNIANFANGKRVGEATLSYGSHFLINFWDPLLERREKNPDIPDVDLDASIGQDIYTDPTKTIFKVLPIDFNKDGLKDMIVVYTDGTVKLIKNYGGTDPYKNMQELMIIADTVKDIKVWDVDGNGYEDIIILTTNNKWVVYMNKKGVFPVDGKNICLNVNAEPDMKNETPDDFGSIRQLFLIDMDQDGKMDIVTQDSMDDTKIFYGWGNNKGANYVSNVTGICDAQRYDRQKGNYTIVKRFWMRVNSSRSITDSSLIHIKWADVPREGIEEEKDEDGPDTTVGMTKDQIDALKDTTLENVKTMVAENDIYVEAGRKQLAYVENPLSTTPIYETLPADEVQYLPISEITNDTPEVSVYKIFEDINGNVLREGDEVVVKTTIISKKNYNKMTYIDQLKGPRGIVKDDENKINSLVFTQGTSGWLIFDRNAPEGYQFVMDNISLNSWAALSFSYRVIYKPENTSVVTIDVKDQDLIKENKDKDSYSDISFQSTDPCQKGRRILFNEKTGQKRTYEEIFDDLQSEINTYNSWAAAVTNEKITDLVDTLSNIDTLDQLSSIPGMDASMEAWSAKNILNSLTQGGLSLNIGMSFIDEATEKVSEKLDGILQGLCQGFKLGKWGSCWLPVPFNQAFLAPWDYHIFWCVPKLPNPLYTIFRTLNTTLGKGMPLLNIPGNRPYGPAYLPIPGFFWYPFKWATDGFFLGNTWWPYPSQFRLYIAPTLTLWLGIAMCFGPYSVGKALPKPFRDLWGNCIVFALPPLTRDCGDNEWPSTTDTYDESFVNASKGGTCNNPPKIGNTIVFADDNVTNSGTNNNGEKIIVSTANFPLQIVAAASDENNPHYTAAITAGTFWGIVAIDMDPTPLTAEENYGNTETSPEWFELKKGEKISFKVLWAKTKGLVKCVVQDWTTRQISYIQNNLTKMTIQIDLPDITTVTQGFGSIGNFKEIYKIYKSLNKQDTNAGYIMTGNSALTGTAKWKANLSKQNINSISDKFGNNIFEAFQKMFEEVPLVNIDTQAINIKIPMMTSDDIVAYINYLKLRVEKNEKILQDRTEMLNEMLALCGTTSKADAKKMVDELTKQKALILNDPKIPEKIVIEYIDQEIALMNEILQLGDNNNATWEIEKTRKEMGADVKNIGINLVHTTKVVESLPIRMGIQTVLVWAKTKQEIVKETFKHQWLLDVANKKVTDIKQCANIVGGIGKFLEFKENTAGLIKSVKQNMIVLQKYKEFPMQLHQRVHVTDKYLTEISSLLNALVGDTMTRLNTNANRYAWYIDAITLIIGAIKTRQAIIDFSVNRSEKCSKCSNDNYGSFSCSLSFLCPKLPIFPIPSFKIPSVYMDLSHMELGMDITLPKINLVPLKIPLPQLPSLPEPPTIDVNRDIMYNLDIDLFAGMSLPTIPVIPEPPTLPEPPSFIPTIKMQLPVLPPAPKIPKILPEINAILKVADFIGKVFCIIKWGIGLVGEKWVKGKIEQITQRSRNVPMFDFFDFTTKFKDPPLQWFDYKIDAYTQLKFNFDGVYDVFNNIAQITNEMVSKNIEWPINKAVERTTDKLNNNSGIDKMNEIIEQLDQDINLNGYNNTTEDTNMLEYTTAYTELRKWLIQFKNSTITDKKTNDKVENILAIVENKSTITPATKQIENVRDTANSIINQKREENKQLEKDLQDYDKFLKKLKGDDIVLVDDTTESVSLKTPLLTIDTPTKNILKSQEDPTKTYLTLNKKMVQGYLDAIHNDGPEKLNMTQSVYNKSKTYLETTQEKIDTALLAYSDTPMVAQGTCTTCNNWNSSSSLDISSYVKGIFVESYSGDEKKMVNTVASTQHIANIGQKYVTDSDFNNDEENDILLWDANHVYLKYGAQETESFSSNGNEVTTYYTKFYSYANEHPRNRYIESLEQIKENSDQYGYMEINDIIIKVIDKTKEVKNFKTEGQTFDNLQLSRKNSNMLGEDVDAYIIKVSNKIDDKDTPSSFWDFLIPGEKPKYILVLPKDTDYKTALLTINNSYSKKPVNLELEDSILAIEYYDASMDKINVTFKELPRKRLYTSIAALTITQEDLSNKQQERFTLYKKSSPRSNQTVAGMQNIWDNTAPVGETTLWRNLTQETISTGLVHEGYINTNYTLKSTWTDNVVVSHMEVRKDGVLLTGKENYAQTGTLDIWGLFFTGTTSQVFELRARDQNGNNAREIVTVNIKIPTIEIVDVNKTGDGTADIIAKISNDLDEWMVIFQRLRNGIWQNIEGSNQNTYGGFDLSPKQTYITWGIFTLWKEIGFYDKQGNEIATIDPDTGELKIKQEYENKIKTYLTFTTHIPVVELRDIQNNITLFQIILPMEAIKSIEMKNNNYQQIALWQGQFWDFDGGYCIKNLNNDCVLYTNPQGAIYIPGIYANSLIGAYTFDKQNKNITFIIKDQSDNPIADIFVQIKQNK